MLKAPAKTLSRDKAGANHGIAPIPPKIMLSKEDIIRRKKMRETVTDRVRAFFDSRGFVEFSTPLIVSSPGMEPNLDPIEVEINRPGIGSERQALITSPEYSMKKLLGAGFERIYTITPVFRNNESGIHNIPEFTMLEWYAPGSYEDLMQETEELLQSVLEDGVSWPRIPYQKASMDEFGDPHVEEERFFVTEYPVAQAALAKIAKTGEYAERFEAFADGMEICNGFAELTDADEQLRRFQKEQELRRKNGKTVFPIDDQLIDALKSIEGSVYGNALGIDRLVMLKYGVNDINDIQLFPYA